MKKAILFARCSTTRQEIDSQVAETKEYAKALGYDDNQIDVIAEVGASAIKLNELYKKTIDRLYSMMESGQYECVICWHINRLCRNDVYAMQIKEKLIENNIQLYVKEPSIKLMNDDGTVNAGAELAFSLFATMSKQQMSEFKAKTARARERNKRNKVFNGGWVRFGYKLDESKHYIIDEDAAKVVYDIFDLYINKDYSFNTLAEEMTLRGYPMEMHNIKDVLCNTIYHDGKKYPPIITEQMYQQAYEKRKSNNMTKQYEFSYFLNRIIRCKCGYGYTASKGAYKCTKRMEEGEHSRELNIKWMDGLLWLLCSNKEAIRMSDEGQMTDAKIDAEIAVLDAKIKTVEQSLTRAETKRQRAKEMYLDGDMNKAEYKDRMKKIGDSVAESEKAIAEYRNEIQKLDNLRNGGKDDYFIQQMKVAETIQSSDEKKMQEIVRRWTKVITIDDDYKVHIELADGTKYDIQYRERRAASGTKIWTVNGKPIKVIQIERTKDGIHIIRPKMSGDDLVVLMSFIGGSRII